MFCPPQRHPSYTFIYDRPVIYRGDTLDQLTFKVAEDDGTPIIPATVCAQVKDAKGDMVLQHDVTIDPVTGEVKLLQIEDTRAASVGKHYYDVEYTMADGTKRTYFAGSVEFLEDKSICVI